MTEHLLLQKPVLLYYSFTEVSLQEKLQKLSPFSAVLYHVLGTSTSLQVFFTTI